MNGKRTLLFLINCGVLCSLLLAQTENSCAASNLLMMITPVLGAGSGTVVAKKEPSLALMAAKGTDKLDIVFKF